MGSENMSQNQEAMVEGNCWCCCQYLAVDKTGDSMHCELWFTCTSQIPLMFCWDRVERVCCLLPWTWWEQRLVMSLGNIVLCHLGSASGYLLSFFTISYQALFCKCRFHVLHHLTYLYYDGTLWYMLELSTQICKRIPYIPIYILVLFYYGRFQRRIRRNSIVQK